MKICAVLSTLKSKTAVYKSGIIGVFKGGVLVFLGLKIKDKYEIKVKTSLKLGIEEASLLNTCHALMAFFFQDEAKPFVWSFIVDSASLSLVLSLSLSRVESTESSGVLSSTELIGVVVGVLVVSHPLLDEIKRNQLLIYRRLRVSASHLDDTSSLSLSSTRTLLSPSSRRYLVCLPLLDDAASQSLSASPRIKR